MTVREAIDNEPKIGATIGALEAIQRSEYEFDGREKAAIADAIAFLVEFKTMIGEKLDSMELK